MFDIWQSVSELRQPCLVRPMPEAFLGSDGLVKTKLLKSMDGLLWEHVLMGFIGWKEPQHEIIDLIPSQKWLNISALQKAVRRGQVQRAIQFAKQGCQLDANHVFRRLAVCALEDVGIGNFLATACCLAVLGDRKHRREAGDAELAAYLAQMLAESPKSRLACDLLSLVEYNPALKPLVTDWVKALDHDLAQHVSDEALPIEQKMLATWLLAGTHRFQSGVLPKSNYRPRAPLMRVMANARMPLILYYIADRGAARTSDALFCSYLQIWHLLKNENEFELIQNKIPASEIIGSFPTEAYDVHTREGKLAVNQFVLALGQLTDNLAPMDMGNAIFRLEGGRLNKEVVHREQRVIGSKAASLEIFGKLDADEASIGHLAAQLPTLNDLRRKIDASTF
ncbi:MAG: hypothetical protein ABJN65_10950 [Parasphingorhabdus sp.]